MVANLLFVSSYTDLGGGETALLALAAQLDPARFYPHLLVPREGQLAAAWQEYDWPVHVTPWRGTTVYFIPALWEQLPITHRIQEIIRDNHIQAVHSDYHSLPMALPAAERAGVPALWTCMGWWFHPKSWQRSFFERSAATFAHSEAIKTGFLGEPPFMPPDSIQVLYPGVNTTRFHPGVDGSTIRGEIGIDDSVPVVGLVARFQDVKGHDVFQSMVREVLREIPETHFIVAGENTQSGADNAYRTRILEAARTDFLLRDRLHYLGFRADIEHVYGTADVVVCSSDFEGYGMSIIEAMACGKPVVSTNRGGPAETVVDGETGFLVPPGDAGGLARHVIELLRDSASRDKMGAAGRARVEAKFSAETTSQAFMKVLDTLLQ